MPSVSNLASLRTNINSFGGKVVSLQGTGINRKVSSANLGGFGDNSIDNFYKDLSELYQYKTAEICLTSTGIIEDYVNKFTSEAKNLLSITKDGSEIPESEEINNLLNLINFKKVNRDKLWDTIYFGSWLHLIRVPKDGDISKASLVELAYPYSSIIHKINGKYEYYVNGDKLELQDNEYNYIPLRIGKLNLILDDSDFVTFGKNLILEDSWLASGPLFHGMEVKLKLYILKDLLTNLIQIQDIVSPNLLLANVDKNTSQQDAVKLSEELETLINQYGDLTQLISSNADLSTLSQFILNNVRVYPDLLGVLRGTDKLDFSRLLGRNNEIRQELSNQEEDLVNGIGIPIDLYKGRSTNRYSALKDSDRLVTRVSSEMDMISDSLIEFAWIYLKSKGKDDPDLKITCNLFDYSFIQGINSTYKYDTSTTYIRNLNDLARQIKDTLESTKGIFVADKLYKYLTDTAELVYPGFNELINPDFLDELNKPEPEESEFDNE
jgi:hypothetical protein